MGIEENKQVVASFLREFSQNNIEAWRPMLAESATWWVAGKPGKFPLAGTMTKTQFVDLIQTILSLAPGGIQLTPVAFTAEGDRVAVEASSYAATTTGKTYENLYHFLFRVRDGKIHEVKEYLDTMHTKEVFVDP